MDNGSFSCSSCLQACDPRVWGPIAGEQCCDIGRAVADIFTSIADLCSRAWQWTYSHILTPIGLFTKNWIARPIAQASVYAWGHKGPILANLIIFAMILVFCGSMYGYARVAKPLVIGLAPALILGGTLTGLFIATFDANPQVASGWKSKLSEWSNAVPDWTKTVLVALASTAFLYLCVQLPYVAGSLLGFSWGVFFVYKAHSQNPPDEPIIVIDGDLMVDNSEPHNHDIHTRVAAIQEAITQLREAVTVMRGEVAQLQEQRRNRHDLNSDEGAAGPQMDNH